MEQQVLDNWLVDGRTSTEQQFRTDITKYSQARKKIMWQVMLTPLAAAAGISIVLFQDNSRSSLLSLCITVPLLGGLLAFRMIRMMKKHRSRFESYLLTIYPDAVVRVQEDHPAATIRRGDIVSIEKGRNGGFKIKGSGLLSVILVPPQMERAEELEKSLGELHPVTVKTSPDISSRLTIPLTLLSLGAMMAIFISHDVRVIIGSAIIFFPIQLWGLISIIRNGNPGPRTTTGIGVMLLFLVIMGWNIYLRLKLYGY